MQRPCSLAVSVCAIGLGATLGLLACRAVESRDELILTRAEKPLGQLSACNQAGCTLDGSPFPRGAIAWIGLGTGDAPPPDVKHPDTDEEHLRDGSVQRGRLLRIDSKTVATDAGSYERSQVVFVHLAGGIPGAAAASTSETQPEHRGTRAEYDWDGTIEVSTTCRDELGMSDWRADYRATFREVPQSDSTPASSRFYPVQLRYGYHASADRDQGKAAPPGDVHLHGDSSGVVSAFDRFGLAPGLSLRGEVLRIDAPQLHVAVPASFETRKDLDGFFSESQARRPGYYDLEIATAGSPPDIRALYQGIALTGGGISEFGGADADALAFLNQVPAYMPVTTPLKGFVEDPDQRQVSGAYSFDDPVNCGAPSAITIRWTFARTRQEIDLDSAGPTVAGCGADLATLEHKMKETCAAAQPCAQGRGGCDASQLQRRARSCQDRVGEYQKASAACTAAR